MTFNLAELSTDLAELSTELLVKIFTSWLLNLE